MESRNEISILGINILFLIMAILLLTVGTVVQSINIKTGLIITEFLLVLLPPLLFLKIKRAPIAHYLRLNRLRLKHGMLIVAITILIYPAALFVNLIVLTIISLIGPIQQPPIPVASNFTEYLVLMAIIAISAGICEEVFFRGMLMRGYEKLGVVPAIAISSILFGMFHFNVQNIAGPTLLGIIFGYLVYRTDSLFAGIIGHTTNNAVAVTIGFLTNTVNERLLQENGPTIQQMPGTFQLAASTFFIGIIALLTGLCAFALLRIIIKDTKKRDYRSIEEVGKDEEIHGKKPSIRAYIPVFLTVAIFLYIVFLQITQMRI